MSISKKILSYIFILFALSLIINLSKDIWRLLHVDDRVTRAEQKLADLKEENNKLKEKLDYYESEEFKEAEIRDKLQMAKPGESIVILPEELNEQEDGVEEEIDEDLSIDRQVENWEKWARLFL